MAQEIIKTQQKTVSKKPNKELEKVKTLTVKNKINLIKRNWFLIDATDKVLGRISTQAAIYLRGKNEPSFDNSKDTGNFVIIVNANKVKLTGKKEFSKKYFHHTGFPKGLREKNFSELLEKKPEQVFKHAIFKMLPKNKLSNKIIKRLKVYSDENHNHKNNKIQTLEI